MLLQEEHDEQNCVVVLEIEVIDVKPFFNENRQLGRLWLDFEEVLQNSCIINAQSIAEGDVASYLKWAEEGANEWNRSIGDGDLNRPLMVAAHLSLQQVHVEFNTVEGQRVVE